MLYCCDLEWHLHACAGTCLIGLSSLPLISRTVMAIMLCRYAGEDDGYLVLFVYDEATKTSDFVVYDATTFSDKPLATVRLPQRVPYGFHGKHMNAADFQSQFPFDIHFLPDI